MSPAVKLKGTFTRIAGTCAIDLPTLRITVNAKIVAVIDNARADLEMQSRGEDLSTFVWGMAGGKQIVSAGRSVPSRTPLSERISKALKERGFKFVGPVATYAWMQATGIVNDHSSGCFRRRAV